MTPRLASHISFCTIADRFVLLDTLQDRYFGLHPADAATLAALAAGGAPPPVAAVAQLAAIGVLATDGDDGRDVKPTVVPVPAISLTEETRRHRARWCDVGEISLRLLSVRRALRRGRLDTLLGALRAAWSDHEELVAFSPLPDRHLVARFAAARRLAPTEPTCLLDTLALAGFLARRHRRATMVFGVKLDPFGAHCWLQTKATILNDTLENAAAFVPILVIP